MLAVVIYAPDADTRRHLKDAASAGSEMRVVGAAGNLVALKQQLAAEHADVVLADVSEQPAEIIQLAVAGVPIVALVGDNEDDFLEALHAGAHSALSRNATIAEIRAAILANVTGLSALPLSLLASLLLPHFDAAAPSGVGTEHGGLTPREVEVLGALADGASNKAIARRFGISVHTVKFHVASILAKLSAESRTEAVAKAARMGLVLI
jgi:DNA-binding NarL/FixJ family response regulator